MLRYRVTWFADTVMIGDDVRDDVLGAQKAGFKVSWACEMVPSSSFVFGIIFQSEILDPILEREPNLPHLFRV